MWTIPPARIPIEGVKYSHHASEMRTEHLVPLSRQVLDLLKQIHAISGEHELVFTGDYNPWKPMSENTVNNTLRLVGHDTKIDVCSHGFRAMVCSPLIESALWPKDAVERQMSHQESNNIFIKPNIWKRIKEMMLWWSDYPDICRETYVPFYIRSKKKVAGYSRTIHQE